MQLFLEHYSELPKSGINVSTKLCPRHAVFCSFFLDNRKQDASTTTSHRKCLIELLKGENILTSALSIIWENTDGCVEQYTCASVLYIMSVMSQFYSVIIIIVSVHLEMENRLLIVSMTLTSAIYKN